MSNVAHITPHLRNVEAPAVIRDLPAWVIWRFEDNPNPNQKPRKVPYYATGGKRTGEQGSPQDVAKLTTFDAAKAAAAKRGFDGVGFATLAQFGICALDFDDCITDGHIHPDIEPLLMDTYAEFSPSGKGIRLFFRGDLGNGKSTSREPYGMECFSSKGFVTFTGNALEATELLGNVDTVAQLSPEAYELHQRRFERSRTPGQVDLPASAIDPVGLTEGEILAMLERLDPDLSHDQWLQVGMGLHHETAGAGFHYWDIWSSTGTKYPGSDTLRQRWESFGRHNDRAVTLRTAMKLAGMGPSTSAASPEEFDALVGDVSETPDAPLRFHVQSAHEFATSAPTRWRIKGVLPDAELVVMYGASGSGKSFMALDMGAAIARGILWRGCKVRQGRVAYIAAEGAGGFRKRLQAYAQAQQIDLATLELGVIHAAPNMMEPKDAADVAKAVTAWGGADLIIVDTFAQVMPGANENAGEDVGKALTHCKRIHESTGAMIMLIHHAGKDTSKGARGWSGLRAAADAELEVVRETIGRSLKLTKSKDGEDGLMWGFELEVVTLGVDEDLDPITSCVVVEHAVPVPGVAARKLGKNEKVVNEVLQEMAQSQSAGIELKPVIDESVRRMMERDGVDADKKGNYRSNARRALSRLCDGADAPYWLDTETNTVEVM